MIQANSVQLLQVKYYHFRSKIFEAYVFDTILFLNAGARYTNTVLMYSFITARNYSCSTDVIG